MVSEEVEGYNPMPNKSKKAGAGEGRFDHRRMVGKSIGRVGSREDSEGKKDIRRVKRSRKIVKRGTRLGGNDQEKFRLNAGAGSERAKKSTCQLLRGKGCKAVI